MRWLPFILLALASAGMALYFQDLLGAYAPAVLFLFAFHVGLHCNPIEALLGWWGCGLLRDLAIGGRLGVSAMIFLLLGMAVLAFRRRVKREHASTQILLVFTMVFILRLAAPLLAWGFSPIFAWPQFLKSCVSSAAFTGALSIPWALTIARLKVYRPEHELVSAFSAGGA
ncbi:MAG: hypothetical protein JXA52_10325 [Planctomycetes bacterium]|nr:hypothetical protein [Planctomycetota bacterium]